MEDGSPRLRGIIEEELKKLLAEMERHEEEVGRVPPPPRLLAGGLGWCLEMVGALLLGLICGILSHAGVILFARALH